MTDDASACVDILREWIGETKWMPTLHARDSMVGFWGARLSEDHAWVATEDGHVIGFCVRVGTTVTALYLSKGAKGRQVGARLLDLARRGMERLELYTFEANPGARRFYARHGFSEIARSNGENEEGLPDIRLAWQAANVPPLRSRQGCLTLSCHCSLGASICTK